MTVVTALSRGFTLIELLVTLSVAAILLAVAVPNFQTFLLNNRMATQANDLITALNLARSEAVKTGSNVVVCIGIGPNCPAQANGASVWEAGWIVRTVAGTVIRVQQPMNGASTLRSNWNSVTYNANGRLGGVPLPVADVVYELCPPAPAQVPGRTVRVTPSGRVAVANLACP